MSNIYRPLSNVASLTTGGIDVFKSTSVAVVTTGTTDRTLTISNTAAEINGGGRYGTTGSVGQAQVYLKAGEYLVINKKSTDKIATNSGTDVRAFGVAKKE